MTVREQIESLKKRQAEVWEAGRAAYLEAVSCSLGLCAEEQSQQDSAAAAERPEDKQKAQARLQALREQKARGWQKVENEVRQLEVTIRTLERSERGELGAS